MVRVVLYRLQDWSVSRHLLPVLRAAGVPEVALGCVHYFHAHGLADPFEAIDEGPGFPAATDALLAASGAVGAFGHRLADTGEDDERTCGFHWSASEEQLIAAARQRKLEVVLARDSASARVDGAGVALDRARAGGAGDAEIIEALREGKLGEEDDGTRDFVLLSFFGRLDAVRAAGEATLRSLIAAAADLPPEHQLLAGYAAAAFCGGERLASFELATVKAIATLSHDQLAARATRAFHKRVLNATAAPLGDLLDVLDAAGGALNRREQPRFDALWKAAVARDEHTLEQWVHALSRELVDRATFDRHVIGPFRRAVQAGFTTAAGGDDRDSFAESVGRVAAADPDLALAGFVALSKNFNTNGLRSLLADAELLPPEGYSAGARAAAAAHFADPAHRAAARTFAKILASWGVEPKHPAPPVLESIDVTVQVGTDVATLVVGSFESVDTISDTEDLDDCARVVRETGSLGFMTGGDGWFRVRVLGALDGRLTAAEAQKGGKLLGVAPLQITGDTLTVSGVVGGGGARTIPFPSGTYAADILGHEGGPLRLTVVIRADPRPPAWPFGEDDVLPGLL